MTEKGKRIYGHWNYETCFEVAAQCVSKVDFKKKYYGAYQKACVMGWISDYTWFVRPVVHNKKWTKDTCYEEAKKYLSRDEFRQGNSGAYQAAKRNEWLDDYYWFSESKTAKKWCYDTCYEEAKKYSTRTKFQEGNGSAYGVARENGWIDDYTWFEANGKPKGWWNNYEHCCEEALKYNTKKEFKQLSSRAYNVALKNGWLNDFVFEEGCKPNGYWKDYDHCYDEAKKYTCRKDFCRKSPIAWKQSKDSGWINDYTWFKTPCPFDRTDYVVYAYRDYDNKVVYIGLTGDIYNRHNGHKCSKKKNGSIVYDTVMSYFMSIGKELPKPIIHMDGLTPNEAQYYEDWYRKAYADNGWRVLNIAPTGEGISSIGGHQSKFVK